MPSGGAYGAAIELIVNLPGVFPAKAEIAGNLLQGGAIYYHALKFFDCIRAVFLLEFPLELIRGFNIKLIAPMRYSGGGYTHEAGNLLVSECFNLHLSADKLFDVSFIDFQDTPPRKEISYIATSAAAHAPILMRAGLTATILL